MATTTTRTSIELQNWSDVGASLQASPQPLESREDSDNEAENYQQLDAIDGGFPAWRVLIGGFVFEAILWGKIISLARTRC